MFSIHLKHFTALLLAIGLDLVIPLSATAQVAYNPPAAAMLSTVVPGDLTDLGLYFQAARQVPLRERIFSIPEKFCLPGISGNSLDGLQVPCAEIPKAMLERITRVDTLSAEIEKLKEKNDQLLQLIESQSKQLSKQREDINALQKK